MIDETNEKNEEEMDADPTEEADDVAFEAEDNETPRGSFGRSKDDVLTQLKERLKKLEAEKQEYLDLAQRTKAEFANLRKRDEEEKRELVNFANEGLVMELLPVLDSFEMAFANKEAWEKADKNWRMGVEYIHSQLVSVLLSHHVKALEPIGLAYDAKRDTPVEHVPAEKPEDDGKIVEVVQKGYEMSGKLLRSPRVKVAEYRGNDKSDKNN